MAFMSSGVRYSAIVILVATAVVTSVDATEPEVANPLALPWLAQVQLDRPADLATILLAQSSTTDAVDSVATTTVATDVRAQGPVKSPKRAFLMSLLVPGTGEFWAGSKKRAALFFGLEMVGLGTYLSWDGKGNDLEDEFRARADTTYNPWNYLAWRDSRNSRFSSITHVLPCSSFVKAAPYSSNRDAVPNAIRNCPGSEKQQFYELIGKYDQFVSGWGDVYRDDRDDGEGNRVEFTEVDSAENFQSATRLSYEIDRDESNKYLKRASNVLGLILVNHVLSSIDAARVARARGLGQDEAVIDRRTRFGVALGGSSGTTPLLMAYRPIE